MAQNIYPKRRIRYQNIQGYGGGIVWRWTYGTGYLLLDFGEEAAEPRYLTAFDLLKVVVRFWRDFLSRYRPDVDLPVSKNHED
jgi:hypothetical protein